MKFKKISIFSLLLLFIVAVLPSGSFASESKIYSFEQMNEFYINNSYNIQISEAQKQLTEIELKELEEDEPSLKNEAEDEKTSYEKAVKNRKNGDISKDTLEEKQDDYYIAYESYYTNLKSQGIKSFEITTYDMQDEQLKSNESLFIDTMLWDYYKSVNYLEILHKKQEIANLEFEVGKVNEASGTISNLQLMELESQLESSKIEAENLNLDIEFALDSIAIYCGLPIDQNFAIDLPEIELSNYEPLNLEDMINNFYENNISFKIEKNEFNEEQKYYENLKQIYDENSTKMQSLQLSYDKTSNSFTTYKNDLESQIVDLYYKYLTAKNDYNATIQQLNLSKEQLNSSQSKYDNSLISKNQLENDKLQYEINEYNKKCAIIDLNMIINKLKLVEKGIKVW